jgi:hypothetical protein
MVELKREFANSMKECFAFCKESGEDTESPPSGKFVLHVDRVVHRATTRAAERAGVNINQMGESATRTCCWMIRIAQVRGESNEGGNHSAVVCSESWRIVSRRINATGT